MTAGSAGFVILECDIRPPRQLSNDTSTNIYSSPDKLAPTVNRPSRSWNNGTLCTEMRCCGACDVRCGACHALRTPNIRIRISTPLSTLPLMSSHQPSMSSHQYVSTCSIAEVRLTYGGVQHRFSLRNCYPRFVAARAFSPRTIIATVNATICHIFSKAQRMWHESPVRRKKRRSLSLHHDDPPIVSGSSHGE
jgi:hypothetical protein